MLINIIKSYRNVVAICDKELLGKYFEEDNMCIDVKESFFKGEQLSEEELIQKIKILSLNDATFNIVGKKSVNAAIKIGLANKNCIRTIQNIPIILILN